MRYVRSWKTVIRILHFTDKAEKKDVLSKKVAWVIFYAESSVKLISSFGLGLIRFIAQKVGRNGLFSLCILFRSHERTKQSSGERLKKYGRRRKNKVFGNLLWSSVLDLAPIYTVFIIPFGVNKWTLNLITYHYTCIGFFPF